MTNLKYSLRILVLIIFPTAGQVWAEPDVVRIAADPWCPYNCDPKSEYQGFMVDIAREAMLLAGYTLSYDTMNWARAKDSVIKGTLDGIVGMAYTDTSKDKYLFSSIPLGISQICFYKRVNDSWTYNSVRSLDNRMLGWINDYAFGSDLAIDEWVENNLASNVLVIAGKDTHLRLFKLLVSKRIDSFAEDRNVTAFELKNLGFNRQISNAGCSPYLDKVHVAFTLKSKKGHKWVEALETGIVRLRQSGRLNEILWHYGLTEESWYDIQQ